MNTVTAFSALYDIWYPYISCQLLDMPGCCQILSMSFISCGLSIQISFHVVGMVWYAIANL